MDYSDVIKKYANLYARLSFTQLAKHIVEQEQLKVSPEWFRKQVARYFNNNKYQGNIEQAFEQTEFQIELPESKYQEEPPYIITERGKGLIISDLHIPYQDNLAIYSALKFGYERGINFIILNGDIIDFDGIKWFKQDKERNTAFELASTKKFLQLLREKFPKLNIYYKFGNHESRWADYLWRNAEQLANLQEFQLEKILQLKEYGIEHINATTTIYLGKLNIIHGHEIKVSSGAVNLARLLLQKAGDNILASNYHIVQEDTTKSIRNKLTGAWVTGCLCGLKPLWLPVNRWGHGFAVATIYSNETFTIDNKKIIDGMVL